MFVPDFSGAQIVRPSTRSPALSLILRRIEKSRAGIAAVHFLHAKENSGYDISFYDLAASPTTANTTIVAPVRTERRSPGNQD